MLQHLSWVSCARCDAVNKCCTASCIHGQKCSTAAVVRSTCKLMRVQEAPLKVLHFMGAPRQGHVCHSGCSGRQHFLKCRGNRSQHQRILHHRTTMITPTHQDVQSGGTSWTKLTVLQDSACCTFVKGDMIVIQVAKWVWMAPPILRCMLSVTLFLCTARHC